MKKIIGFVAAALLAMSVFAGPFGDLANSINSLDMSKSQAALGKLPNGRELLPVLFKYAKADSESDKRVTDFYVKFSELNPIDKEYKFTQTVIFKFGGGLQKQESEIIIKQDGSEFSVVTASMTTGNVSKKGEPTNKPIPNPPSTLNKNSKYIAGDFEKMAKSLSDEEYMECLNKALTSPFVLYGSATKSALAFKKFLKDNEVIGRKISETIIVTKVDEAPSTAEGYSYYVRGNTIGGYIMDPVVGERRETYVTLYVYTNNDDAVSLTPTDIKDIVKTGGEAGSKYNVNGSISDVTRTETNGLMFITMKVNE